MLIFDMKNLESITLALGKTIQSKQYIQLADKVNPLFARLKGNVLPVRNYTLFLDKQAPHFEHVDLLVDHMSRSVTFTDNAEMIEAQDLGIGSPTPSFRAISIMGLVVDEIQYFEIENDVAYAYTQVFKIDIAKALAHQEITLLENGQLYSKKDLEDICKVIEEINEAWVNYMLRIMDLREVYHRTLNHYALYFTRRSQWEIKAYRWGASVDHRSWHADDF